MTTTNLVWNLETSAPLPRVWDVLSDLDALHRVAGLGFKFEERIDNNGHITRAGRAHWTTGTVRWEEQPLLWAAPYRWESRRDFVHGHLASMITRCHLSEVPNGTAIRFTIDLAARNDMAVLPVTAQARNLIRPGISRALDTLLAHLDSGEPFDGPPPDLEPEAEQALEDAVPALGEFGVLLASYLRTAQLHELRSISPAAFATFLERPHDDVLAEFFNAVKAGVLDLEFAYLCPECLGARGGVVRIGAIEQHTHCLTCDRKFDGRLASSAIAQFRPARTIRDLPPTPDSLYSPRRTPHILVRWPLDVDADLELDLTLDPGIYVIEAGPRTPARVEVVADGPTGAFIVEVHETGVQPSSLRLGAGTSRLTLRSRGVAAVARVARVDVRTADLFVADLVTLPQLRHILPPNRLERVLEMESTTAAVVAIAGKNLREALAATQPKTWLAERDFSVACYDTLALALGAAEELSKGAGRAIAVDFGPVVRLKERDVVVPTGKTVTAALDLVASLPSGKVAIRDALSADAEALGAVAQPGPGCAYLSWNRTPERAEWPLPKVLGRRFPVKRDVGASGAARVLEVTDAVHETVLTARLLSFEERVEPYHLQRFLRDVAATAAHANPQWAGIVESGIVPDYGAYAVEAALPGTRDFARAIGTGALPLARVARLGASLLHAVTAAHAKGIVHGGLHAAHLWVRDSKDRGEEVVIGGFGVTPFAADPNTAARNPIPVPTETLAPEQITGDPVDARADLYAVGVLLYRMLSGKYPFEARDARTAAQERLRRPAVPLLDTVRNLPAPVATVVMRALAQAPAERWGSAAEMATAWRQATGI